MVATTPVEWYPALLCAGNRLWNVYDGSAHCPFTNSCHLLWPCSCHGNHADGIRPISSFSSAINLQLNAEAFYEKSFITCLFWRSYANLFSGSFFETQCIYTQSSIANYTLNLFTSPHWLGFVQSGWLQGSTHPTQWMDVILKLVECRITC